jgi:hypothetical protein
VSVSVGSSVDNSVVAREALGVDCAARDAAGSVAIVAIPSDPVMNFLRFMALPLFHLIEGVGGALGSGHASRLGQTTND